MDTEDRIGGDHCRDHYGEQACRNPELGHITKRYSNLKSEKNEISNTLSLVFVDIHPDQHLGCLKVIFQISHRSEWIQHPFPFRVVSIFHGHSNHVH